MNTRLSFLLVIVFAIATGTAYAQASGGRLPSSSTTKPKTTNDSTDSVPTKPGNRSQTSTANDRIDGKWLTTGNDFGTSEVVFAQSGSNVTGTITWADGRTGNLTGTFAAKRLRFSFTTSTGETASGWLELSWPQFLGGPWKSARVKDGSWTMSRIEGQWCLDGDRSRIRRVTHDASGHLTITTEDGAQQTGYVDGYLYLNSPNGPIKGDTLYPRRYRIEWANGTMWTWCGR
ncbi:MAG TPA: hypothetical protein VF251_06250 [Pyrinomonadaceae bacterium]